MRAVAYLRISKDAEESTSIDRQRADITSWADSRGIEIAEWFEDVGRSAWRRNAKRPAHQAMLARAVAGDINKVVVWRLDRLSRSLLDFVRTADQLDAAGVGLALTQQDFDTATPIGRMVLRILVTFAEFEAEQISARTKSMHDHRARDGVPMWTRRVFGWDKEGKLISEEAHALRRVIEAILGEDISYHEGARRLNLDGVTTSTGAAWTPQTLWKALRSPRLVGWGPHHDDVLRDKAGQPVEVFEPLIDELMWRRLGRRLEERTAWHPPSTRIGEGTLLSGLAVCDHCGAKMRRSGPKTKPMYVCRGAQIRTCKGAIVSARWLDREVVDRARAEAAGEQWKNVGVDHQAEMDRLRARRDGLIEAAETLSRFFFTEQLIDEDEFRRRRVELRRDQAAVEDELLNVTGREGEVDQLLEFFTGWDDRTFSEKREALRWLIFEVRVRRAVKVTRPPRWDGRVLIRWRHRDSEGWPA